MKVAQLPLVWGSLSSLLGGNKFVPTVDPLPAPREVAWKDSGAIRIADDIRLDIGEKENRVITEGFQRTLAHIRTDRWVPYGWDVNKTQLAVDAEARTEVSQVLVQVTDWEVDLQLGVDESYSLDIGTDGKISVSAETVWGALHAFTTLEQLIIEVADGVRVIEGALSVRDEPRFPHRGLMIDTARNFYSVESLKRQIDALSLAKMNVFHWHLTDTQSWPIEVPSFPEMTEDAFSPREVYTADDVADLVSYARARGVRVIPELDLPGHSNSGWRRANSGIITCGDNKWEDVSVEPNPGQLEITKPETYDVLEKVYTDVSALFPDNHFHVGFDEVNFNCFRQSPTIREWLEQPNEDGLARDAHDLVQYWVDKSLPVFYNKEDRKLIMWQDSVLSKDIAAKYIPQDIVLQSWVGGLEVIRDLISRGYGVIATSAEFVYLDCGFANWISNDPRFEIPENPTPGTPSYNYGGSGGSWCAPYKSWQRMYSYNFDEGLNPHELKQVLGSEAALWSEQADSTVVDGIVWPRTAALGELLWSGNKDASGNSRLQSMTSRILNFRERLVGRGINAQPLMPKYCTQNPGRCDFNYVPGDDDF